MWPLLAGPLIGAAASSIGSIFQNQANSAAADKQMKFQKEMSDTSYQRGVKDMEKAGINPMLAYAQGGASSAAGAAARSENVGAAAVEGAKAGVSSASQAQSLQSQIENMQADTALKGTQQSATRAAAVASMAQANLASENSATVSALRDSSVQSKYYEAELGKSRTTAQEADNTMKMVDSNFYNSPFGSFMRQLGLTGTESGKAVDAVGKGIGAGVRSKFLR